MRRPLLIVAVIAAIVAFVLVWRTGDDAPKVVDAGIERVAAPAAVHRVGSGTAGQPGTASRDRVVAPDAALQNPADLQARVQEAHAYLQDAAKPCLASSGAHPAPDAIFRVGFRITVAGGTASISELHLVWSDLQSEALEGCLLDALAKATWPVPEGDGSTTVEDILTPEEMQ